MDIFRNFYLVYVETKNCNFKTPPKESEQGFLKTTNIFEIIINQNSY